MSLESANRPPPEHVKVLGEQGWVGLVDRMGTEASIVNAARVSFGKWRTGMDARDAKLLLEDWCARARASGIRMLQKFANTLAGHRSGILAWYDYPISTAPLEGTNNKITTLKRQAYGYRDQEYFRLKLFALHLSHYELIG